MSEGFISGAKLKCPHCGATEDPYEVDVDGVTEEGVHELDCWSCDEPFEVETIVSSTFESRKKETE